MTKASMVSRKLRNTKKGTSHIILPIILLLLGAALLVQGNIRYFSAVDAVSGKWTGDIRIAGFSEDGHTYMSKSELPSVASSVSWGTDSLTVDIDGPARYFGYAGIGSIEINTDLPKPTDYINFVDYPTAKPKIVWTIMDNIRHVDVNNYYLSNGKPSVTTQENGYLVEVYYYTFSVKLDLVGSKVEEHDWYEFNVDGWEYGCRYSYDLSALHGLYLIPEVSLTSDNSSIIDMGSDMATYGGTMWKFYNIATGSEASSTDVQKAFADNSAGVNRDFFLAGGDSGAGLNIINKVDENTNQFSVGFVKVGIPAYITGGVVEMTFNTMQTTAYNIELVIPLRLSVIVTYNIPYTGSDIYGEGDENTEEQDFFKNLEGELNAFAAEQDLSLQELGLIVLGVGFVLLILVRRMR